MKHQAANPKLYPPDDQVTHRLMLSMLRSITTPEDGVPYRIPVCCDATTHVWYDLTDCMLQATAMTFAPAIFGYKPDTSTRPVILFCQPWARAAIAFWDDSHVVSTGPSGGSGGYITYVMYGPTHCHGGGPGGGEWKPQQSQSKRPFPGRQWYTDGGLQLLE